VKEKERRIYISVIYLLGRVILISISIIFSDREEQDGRERLLSYTVNEKKNPLPSYIPRKKK
jgi:hypothetical protein